MADNIDNENNEEELIKYYFFRGYEYKDILRFLSEYHDIIISKSTLQRRLRSYGISRRNAEYNIDTVTNDIREMLDGPECLGGYRYVWHALKMKGHQVPRTVVQLLLKDLDPEGCSLRKRHRLRRRVYRNEGPNAAWHADGYDKLKPYGFAVHGCIDGWSRKLLWLLVTQSNNYPDNIACYFLEAVEKYGGCPMKVYTDLGTENSTMAAIQCFFRNDDDAHCYCSSPRNQRIEGFWSCLRRSRTTWWMNFLKDVVEEQNIDTGAGFQRDCLWFCFAELIQNDLDAFLEHWNSHKIRRSRYDTISGKPDALYFLPEQYGGMANLTLNVPQHEIDYAKNNLVEKEEHTESFEYFQYVVATCGFRKPTNWREGLELFKNLIQISGQ